MREPARDTTRKRQRLGREQVPVFDQGFKNIDDVLRKEAGCTIELDYTEQKAWLLFRKYLDGLEQDLAIRLRTVALTSASAGQELDQDKLTPLLRLRYHNSIADAVADLGRPDEIKRDFTGFQKYLYQQQAA